MPTTPNMGLLLPIPTVTPGPTYASENNDAFDVIDAHDHSPGKGVPVSSNGININADLTFAAFNATNLRSTQYINNGSPLSLPGDVNAVYVANGNLYYNNQLGQQVQITNGAALNATVIGGIGGDYTTSTALEFYTALTRTFTFWSAPNVPANLDAGSITIREIALSPNGITISSPTALPADYTLTLPAALPVSTSAVSVDPTGQLIFSGGVTPVGGMIMYGGAAAPTGWLLCDGTSYTVASNPNLAAALFDIGTGFYAYGSTTEAFASYTGTPTGATTPITLTAVMPGVIGDSITLVFTGSNSINSAIVTWNTGNPSNTVTLTAGDGTQVPSNGATTPLTGGIDGAFNVPDFRGLFPRGVDPTGVNDPDFGSRTASNPNGNIGGNVGSFQVDAESNHRHNVTFTGIGGPVVQIVGSGAGTTGSGNTNFISAFAGGVTVASTESRPKNLYVNFIIKS